MSFYCKLQGLLDVMICRPYDFLSKRHYLKNEFEFWKVHDFMNLPKIEFIAYIYILYYQSSINFQFSPNLAGFPDILN